MIKASAPTLFAGKGSLLELGVVSAAGGITVAPGGTWSSQGFGFFLLGMGGKSFQRRMGGRLWFRGRGRGLTRGAQLV